MHTLVTEKLHLNVDEEVAFSIENLHEQLQSLATVFVEEVPEVAKNAPVLECTVKFSDDQTVHLLNKQFRGKDKPTNVLSFPNEEDFPLPEQQTIYIGDIILARETVEKEAVAQSKTRLHHTLHLVAHGLLHLMGYDHIEEGEAEEMEALEVSILAKLGIADPYK